MTSEVKNENEGNASKAADLSTDFGENYKVSDDRAQQIRRTLEVLRQETWLVDLKLLVTERGLEELPSETQKFSTTATPLFESSSKIFRKTIFDSAELLLSLSGADLICSYESKTLLECSFFPKSADVAIYFVDNVLFESFPQIMTALKDDIAEAKSLKQKRVPNFKKKSESIPENLPTSSQ